MERNDNIGFCYSPVPLVSPYADPMTASTSTNFMLRSSSTPNTQYRTSIEYQRAGKTGAVEWRGLSKLSLFAEAFNIALGVFFLATGFVFISLNQEKQTNWSDKVVQFSRIMPTIWPIVFASILGNTIKWFVYWRVESAIELQSLDCLLSSQTLASSIRTIITYRNFTIVTGILLTLWSLSPLGSQALLRALELETKVATMEGNISYVDPGLAEYWDNIGPFCCTSGINERFRTITGVYSSVLFRPDIGTQYNKLSEEYDRVVSLLGGPQHAAKELAMDVWGNVRIPAIHRLGGYDPNNPLQWVDVPQDNDIQDYSSLIGFIYRGIPALFKGNTTMVVNQSYHKLSCSPWTVEYPDEFNDDRSPWLDEYYPNMKIHSYNSTLETWSDIMIELSGGGFTYFFLDTLETFPNLLDLLANHTSVSPRHIVFGSRGEINSDSVSADVLSFTSCTVEMEYIQAHVTCQSFGTVNKRMCGVDRIRKNPEPPYPNSVSVFEWTRVASNFALTWPGVLEFDFNPQAMTLTEIFVLDPGAKLGNGDFVRFNLRVLSELPIETFEDRVGLLMNTYLRASTRYSSVVGIIDDLFNETVSNETLAANTHNITSEMSYFLSPTYSLSKVWITIYFIASSFLFAAALAAFFFRIKCRAPEILSFVTSMTRDNEYFKNLVSQVNSTQVGPDIPKKLKKMRVMIGDVRPDNDVGKIAFAPAGMAQIVRKRRLYV